MQNVWRALNPPNASGFIASSEAWGGLTYVPSGTPGQGRLIVGGWYFSNLGANAFVSVYENLHTSSPTRPHSIVINTPGARADWVLDNKVDNQGNIYIAGFTTGNLQGTHIGEGDAFIIKYSPQLTNPIIKQLGTTRSDLFRKLVIDDNSNLFAVGYSYGNYNGNTNTDPSQKTADIIVQQFDQNLNLLASHQFGTPHEDRGYCYLKDSILFIGGMTEGAIKSASNGSFDGFLLALNTTDLSFNSNPVLSTNELEMSETIKYYPNPTTGIVQFELSDAITYNYILTNYLGQQLQTGKLNNSNNTISLSIFPKGIYIITLVDLEKSTTFKIIKE